jgi:hypothetical protein
LGGGEPGDGGDGLVQDIDYVQASGVLPTTKIFGGSPGSSPCGGGASIGWAVLANGLFRHSGVAFNTPINGAAQQAVPPDPFLADLSGQLPSPGATIVFTVYGALGDQVTLYLGRSPVVEPIPGVLIEKLTTEERALDLGSIGASGYVGKPLTLPATLPKGYCFFSQARILRAGSELRTNSIPIVIR